STRRSSGGWPGRGCEPARYTAVTRRPLLRGPSIFYSAEGGATPVRSVVPILFGGNRTCLPRPESTWPACPPSPCPRASRSATALPGGLALGLAPPAGPGAKPAGPAVLPYRISEPVTHGNLTVFFLYGEDQIKGKKILTLDEALKEKKVVVHETKNVSQLAI